jgi:hypothetical protein
MRACPSELVLDRLFVGELADSSHDGVREHVGTCVRCSGRLDDRKAAAATFASDVGLDLRVAAAARELRTPRWRTAAIAGGAIAAAAVVLLLVVPRKPAEQGQQTQVAEAPTVRTKGGLSLGLVAKRLDGRIESVVSPAALSAGEAIQFEISTQSAGFVAVVGVDAAGVVSPYATSRRIEAGSRQLLDGSIVLDDTPGSERIIAVMCQTEVDMHAIVDGATAALAQAGGNPARIESVGVPATCSQASFLIEKKAR